MKEKSLVTMLVVFTLVCTSVGFSSSYTAYASDSPTVYVFIDKQIYGATETSLNQYKDDLLSEGYDVIISNVTGSTSASSMRQTLAGDPDVVGCLLVGHTPVVWYEVGRLFATDFYFMDLDGTWLDSDEDGRYDGHVNGTGDVQPEIWCGRIKGWGPNEADMVNTYFAKVHKLRTGQLVLPQRALAYIDDDWAASGDQWPKDVYGPYYDEVTVVIDKETTNADDYKQRLTEGYEHIDLSCHGNVGEHTFKVPDPSNPEVSIWDGTVNGSDYINIDPKSFMINFGTCFAATHTLSDGSDADYYLAGSWIFSPTYGMIAVGSTTVGGMGYLDDFYTPLFGQGKTVGEAFKEWAVKNGEKITYGHPNYDVSLIGDPTLKKPKVVVHAQDQYGNTLARGDVYVDSLLYAYSNSTIRIWLGNHTIFINDHWENTTDCYTTHRFTFSNWEDNSTNAHRNITVQSNLSLSANFTKKYCPADVNGDSKVDIKDIAMVAKLFGVNRGDLDWDSRADIVCDNKIDIKDVAYASSKFGEIY
ncbi:hypothetical protein GTO27_09260 [Candidatus Bathyarchaeota archaeon]|nr:hypothetical protein [Candidatus Bathyarchaeota archaeon]